MIGIKAISTYFPGEELPLDDLLEYQTLDNHELEYCRSAGIASVHIADSYQSFDLALGASRKLLEETSLPADNIDLIIYIKSRVPEQLISSDASRLQYELKASKAMVIGISDLGCADMSMALKLAADYLTANMNAENVLIAYGAKPHTPNRVRVPVTIYGDGGLATVVSRTSDCRILDMELCADGRYWDLFKLEYKDKVYENYVEECSDQRIYGFELAIQSRNRFSELNEQLLARNDLKKSDIRHFILQNISSRAYSYYETAFEIKFSPVCLYNLNRYGHLGPSDILQNLHTGISNGLFLKGEKILIMNNSPAAAWSTTLIEF